MALTHIPINRFQSLLIVSLRYRESVKSVPGDCILNSTNVARFVKIHNNLGIPKSKIVSRLWKKISSYILRQQISPQRLWLLRTRNSDFRRGAPYRWDHPPCHPSSHITHDFFATTPTNYRLSNYFPSATSAMSREYQSMSFNKNKRRLALTPGEPHRTTPTS